MLELAAEEAEPREFLAAAEFTALLLACAPLLLALAEVVPAAEEPAWLPWCCAEAAAEELFPA
jgi:hypothetical protein